ncbi:hypothetical protein PIB30_018797 [Stylosanthes scabra]|uniref:RRM domain-containing protein n=1 Tax=Stylosanthes scabra TaxID=79078 RepID=A0ABU6R8B0_9FABA|nr:hypothetical protein [Stylosanthes scabra]
MDVYLSRKIRAKNPLKFAFIRYKTRDEVLRTIEQLNGWIVWGCKLLISESKYRRSVDEDKMENPRTEANGIGGKQPRSHDPEYQVKRGNGEKTYKEVLMETEKTQTEKSLYEGKFQTLGDSKIYLDDDKSNWEKLNRSLVGETLNPYNLGVLKDGIMMALPSVEDVKMMGPMKAVLTFNSENSMLAVVKSNALANYVLETRRWSLKEANWSRSYWLEVTGLLLHGWTRSNMLKIGEARATMIIEGESFEIFVKEVGGLNEMRDKRRQEEGAAMVTEEEESIVGETQLAEDVGEKERREAQNHASDGMEIGNGPISSPTKTNTLEDNRTTEQVLKEWDEELYQVQGGEDGPRNESPTKSQDMNQVEETESPSLSVPPGFE